MKITICRQYLNTRFIAIFITIAFVVLACSIKAQAENPVTNSAMPKEASAYQRFASLLSELQAMEGEFEQVVLDGEGHQIQKTQGDFKVKRPGYFWWEVAPPYEQIVVGTPDSLKVYDPDLEQLTVHDESSLAGSPAMLISGDIAAVKKNYQMTLEATEGEQTFKLKHLIAQPDGFETLLIRFSPNIKSGETQLNMMQFSDKLGQLTQITFSKIERNPGLSVNSFELAIPEGTDVIVDE